MPVPWGRLKAWVEAQEQAERSGFHPDPPSKTQIAALSHVVDFLDGPEPTAEIIGKLDYVSELMRESSFYYLIHLKLAKGKKKRKNGKEKIKPGWKPHQEQETIELSS